MKQDIHSGRTGSLLPKPLVIININYSWSNNLDDMFYMVYQHNNHQGKYSHFTDKETQA